MTNIPPYLFIVKSLVNAVALLKSVILNYMTMLILLLTLP